MGVFLRVSAGTARGPAGVATSASPSPSPSAEAKTCGQPQASTSGGFKRHTNQTSAFAAQIICGSKLNTLLQVVGGGGLTSSGVPNGGQLSPKRQTHKMHSPSRNLSPDVREGQLERSNHTMGSAIWEGEPIPLCSHAVHGREGRGAKRRMPGWRGPPLGRRTENGASSGRGGGFAATGFAAGPLRASAGAWGAGGGVGAAGVGVAARPPGGCQSVAYQPHGVT